MSPQEAAIKREEKIITAAVAASKASDKTPATGSVDSSVKASGGKPDKASSAGSKPKPEEKQF